MQLGQALEPMVKGLVGHLEGLLARPALRHNRVHTVPGRHLDALLPRRCRADGAGRRLAVAAEGGHLLAVDHRLLVGQHLAVLTADHGDRDGLGVGLQAALFHQLILAVLIPVPDLLAQVIDDPLGLAVLGLGHLLADGPRLGLGDCLLAGWSAHLGGVLSLLDLVVAEHLLGKRSFGALWLGLQSAGGDGDVGADALRHLILALLGDAVGADGWAGGVVLQLAVAGDVHTVLVVTGRPLVVAATRSGREGGHQPQTRYQNKKMIHDDVVRSCVVRWH